MVKNSVVVKQNPVAVRVTLIAMACIKNCFAILRLLICPEDKQVVFAFFVSIVICLFFAATAKLFMKTKDTYTKTGMIRKRGDKVLYEIEWKDVEKIIYRNNGLILSIIILGPPSLVIRPKEPLKDKRRATAFRTYYSTKDVKKIQTIVPIEIEYKKSE